MFCNGCNNNSILWIIIILIILFGWGGCGCGCGCDCDARPFWKGLEEQINSYVDGHTLAQCMRVNEKIPAVSAARNEDKVVQYE